MRSKKQHLGSCWLAGVIVASFLAAACGGNDGEGTDAAEDREVDPLETVDAPADMDGGEASDLPAGDSSDAPAEKDGGGESDSGSEDGSDDPPAEGTGECLGGPAGYIEIWRDDFNTLDRGTWDTCEGTSRKGNGEKEIYRDSAVSVSDGILRLTTWEESYNDGEWQFDYASGSIDSHESVTPAYGWIEGRIRMPSGQGIWPAFWLFPVDRWPPEIDIIEILGHEPERVYMTFHWLDDAGEHQSDGDSYVGPDYSQDFHVFAVKWEPGILSWYIDGELVRALENPFIDGTPMRIVANLAVGGYWPGYPDETTAFPAVMEVDYIRLCQLP